VAITHREQLSCTYGSCTYISCHAHIAVVHISAVMHIEQMSCCHAQRAAVIYKEKLSCTEGSCHSRRAAVMLIKQISCTKSSCHAYKAAGMHRDQLPCKYRSCHAQRAAVMQFCTCGMWRNEGVAVKSATSVIAAKWTVGNRPRYAFMQDACTLNCLWISCRAVKTFIGLQAADESVLNITTYHVLVTVIQS